jgi:hypothetical protein
MYSETDWEKIPCNNNNLEQILPSYSQSSLFHREVLRKIYIEQKGDVDILDSRSTWKRSERKRIIEEIETPIRRRRLMRVQSRKNVKSGDRVRTTFTSDHSRSAIRINSNLTHIPSRHGNTSTTSLFQKHRGGALKRRRSRN